MFGYVCVLFGSENVVFVIRRCSLPARGKHQQFSHTWISAFSTSTAQFLTRTAVVLRVVLVGGTDVDIPGRYSAGNCR